MLNINEIKSLMSPLDHPAYSHFCLLNPSDGKHAINLALLRWCGGATQVSLTQYALPFDATGRSYILDVFIGEVVDVTGQLGGFNFQWAWASGYAAAQYV